MKNTLANKFRAEMIEKMNEFLKLEVGDDIGQINSNTLNFPIVVDGEEGWCEIVIKVTKDDGDDGYLKREEYTMKLEENARKRAEKELAKQKKIERDKKAREESFGLVSLASTGPILMVLLLGLFYKPSTTMIFDNSI